MTHITKRLKERGINIDAEIISRMAKRCSGDSALILLHLSKKQIVDKSNGDLVYLIVRHKSPITVMFRRSDQCNKLELEHLKVSSISDISEIIKNYKIKEK